MVTWLNDGGVCTPQGFLAGQATAGIKASGKPDMALLFSTQAARCFGVFTRNQVQAAPVLYDREVLKNNERVRLVLTNSGNANACTGEGGYEDCSRMAVLVEKQMGVATGQALVCSTGVIGRRLPMDKVEAGIKLVCNAISKDGNADFAQGIMTTDTVPKTLGAVQTTGLGEIRMGGACKGSGMIHPDMATMLAYITTDLELPLEFMAEFRAWVDASFNAITVDGDTSTNDTCLLLANGASGISWYDLSISEQGEFRRTMEELMRELSLKIVRDGEGATRLVEICVKGAISREEALRMARFVGTSSLVKTAMFGKDPNWGRIISSAGSSGASLNPAQTDLFFEDLQVLRGGSPQAVDRAKLLEIVARPSYRLVLDLHLGNGEATAYTCDLSYEYIRINAEYTT